ncbi:unnamed protein product, partial [Rotaria magnacalcarata]
RWTDIPVSKLSQTERERLLKLSDHLHENVIGQDGAVDSVAETVLRSRAGLSRQNQSNGSFLFLGPAGVGKTELAKTLALELFDSTESMIRIDMSEYTESHSIARLIGALPARTVDFTNTIIVLTSNIGAQYILEEVENPSSTGKRFDGKLSQIIKDRVMKECPPCRRFTPKLAEAFKRLSNEVKKKFDMVSVSCNENSESFDEYFKEMPWKALPFSDRDRSTQLGEKYGVEGIPALIIVSSTYEILTPDGVDELRAALDKGFDQWSQ